MSRQPRGSLRRPRTRLPSMTRNVGVWAIRNFSTRSGRLSRPDEEPGREATHGLVLGRRDLDRLVAVHVAALAEHDVLRVGAPLGVQPLDLVVDLAEERLAKIAGARRLHSQLRRALP